MLLTFKISSLLLHFTQDLHELAVGVALRFTINAKLFDLSWSHDYMNALVQELVFADHAAIVSND